jgi:iron-sulfur cluster assembly protein
LGFDKPSQEDKLYQKEGIHILISRKHLMHLIGLELDFHDGSDTRGFMFSDPSESPPEQG